MLGNSRTDVFMEKELYTLPQVVNTMQTGSKERLRMGNTLLATDWYLAKRIGNTVPQKTADFIGSTLAGSVRQKVIPNRVFAKISVDGTDSSSHDGRRQRIRPTPCY